MGVTPVAQEKTRYTDEELEEFRVIINAKLNKARNDLSLFKEASTEPDGNNGTYDTSPTFKVLEEGYQVFSKEENSKFAARQEKFIKHLENALVRISNKTYGICRVTGKLIPKERLWSVPHATTSVEGKTISVQEDLKKTKAVGVYERH
ncbi:MAG TPA: TraR/DksA family transcriptional regulator [Candidatus Paceibacterota bacterium]|nr:TraR/DksA family transcriptional regulator [Candidatus Paceibacterota bacterium]HPT17813.1 TraR/DksA family transcriptional regulator [Candidatus Paceibacterota bacterium]